MWDVTEGGSTRSAALESGGHRSDIRAVSLSPDDSMLLSASSAGCRLWNPRTGACLRSMDCGYGLCAVWAPGNRHVVVGTKVG